MAASLMSSEITPINPFLDALLELNYRGDS
jgi:hypothetical protein